MIRFKPALSSLVVLLAIGFCQPAAYGGTREGAEPQAAVKTTQVIFTIKGMT